MSTTTNTAPALLTDERLIACIRSAAGPAVPMGLLRDRGPYEVTEPTLFARNLASLIEREVRAALAQQQPAASGAQPSDERIRELEAALRPFAELAGSGRLNWAAVQYSLADDPERQQFQRSQMQRAFNRAADVLAAAPAAAQPAQRERKPLTDEQIEAGRKAIFSTDNPFCPCDRKTMRKAVQWAERAHGIGAAAPAGEQSHG